MKKVRFILGLMIVFMFAFVVKANAYEMSFGQTPAQVSPGEEFYVEISVDENTYLANGHMKYDPKLFTYVGTDQKNMSAKVYDKEGDVSWMYTEISGSPSGTKSFKLKFKARNVTETSTGNFEVTGLEDEGAKFITTNDETYSDTDVAGRKIQAVTIYVPKPLDVTPSSMDLEVGDTSQITSSKGNLRFVSGDTSIATVDANGWVTGVGQGSTYIKVTDEDGQVVDVYVNVKEKPQVVESDDTTANKFIPQTGAKGAFIVLVVVVAGVGIVCFIKYKKYRKLFIIIPLIGVMAIPGITKAFSNVKDNDLTSGVFRSLKVLSDKELQNIVAVSQNNAFTSTITKETLEQEGGTLYENNLGVKKITNNKSETLEDGASLGTGYTITTYVLGDEAQEETDYTFLLYGDADGNATYCDENDIDVIRQNYVAGKAVSDLNKVAANLYAYDDMLDVSDIERMILKKFNKLSKLQDNDPTDTTAVNPFPAEDSSLKINPNKVKLNTWKYEDDDLTSKSVSVEGNTGSVTWESLNEKVATVNSDGTITAVSKGNAVITATDENGEKATVYVIVKNPACSITLKSDDFQKDSDGNTTNEWYTDLEKKSEETGEMVSVEPLQLEWDVIPNTDPLADGKKTFTSSDTSVATVDEGGKITPVGIGEATITVTIDVDAKDTAEGVARTLKDTCKVIVHQSALEEASFVKPGSVTLDLNEEYNEKTADVKIYLTPEYADSKVTWSIKDNRSEVKIVSAPETPTYETIDDINYIVYTATVEGVTPTPDDDDATIIASVDNLNPNKKDFTKEIGAKVIKSASAITSVDGIDPDDAGDKDTPLNTVNGETYPIIDGQLILPLNSSYYMGVTYDPEDATSAVDWSSTDKKIATVSSISKKIGRIDTLQKTGKTYVKATTTDRGVESEPVEVYVADLKIDGTTSVEAGLEITDLKVRLLPQELQSNYINWKTSDKSIATVTGDGIVKGIRAGKVNITAVLLAADGSETAVSDTVEITVNPSLSDNIVDSITIGVGEKYDITDGTELNDSDLEFNSKRDNIASVNDNGVITGVTPGTTQVTVKYADGTTSKFEVKVIVGTIEVEDLNIKVGDKVNPETLVRPSVLNNNGVTYTIDKPDIATIGTRTGTVEAKKCGTATITATINDTNIKTTAKVIVTDDPVIDEDKILLPAADSGISKENRDVTIKYAGDFKNLTITQTNESAAIIKGTTTGFTIIPQNAGKTTITVTDPEGDSDSVEVIVADIAISGVSQVEAGQTSQYSSEIVPDDVKASNVYWEVSDSTIADITSAGTLTAKKAGTVTVTATLVSDGEITKITDSKTITIVPSIDIDNDEKIILAIGESTDITADTDLNDSSLSFESNDSKVATVDKKGNVKGVSEGTTYVNVKYADGTTKTVKVTVIVGSISLNDMTIAVGDKETIEYKIKPSTLSTYGVTYSIADSSIATIAPSTGLVTGVKCGETTVTASIDDTNIKTTCKVKVTDDPIIKEEQIILAEPSGSTAITYPIEVKYGGNLAELTASSSTDGIITYIANSTGYTITPVKAGTTTFKVADSDGDYDSVKVIVGKASISGNTQLEAGTSTQLNAEILPDDIKTADVYWKIDDSSVATISSSGELNAIKPGTVTVTATILNDGNPTDIVATKTITVNPKIDLNNDKIVLAVGGTQDITAGTSLNDGILSFTSADTGIATVGTDGVVKGVKAGTTEVTVQYKNGTTSTVKVEVIVGEIKVKDMSLAIGGTKNVDYTLNPAAELSAMGITYSISDTSVADIGSSTGIVTAKKYGTATITATVNGTAIKGTGTLTVTDNPVIDEDQIILVALASGSTADTYDLKVNYGGTISSLKPTMSTSGVATTTATATGYTITPTKAGTTTLTVTDPEGDSDSVEIIVGSASISGNSQLEVGTSTQLTATIEPDEIKTNGVYWESSDPSIATVGSDGEVTAVKAGTVTITATVLDSDGKSTNIKASKTITVNPTIDLKSDRIVLAVGGTQDITAGTSLNDGILSFTSADTGIATVGTDGVVKGVKAGTTEVTVQYKNGTTSKVKVDVIVGSITVKNMSLAIDGSKTVDYTLNPAAELSAMGITYSISDTSIADIGSSTGIVTAKKYGTATITATVNGTAIKGTGTLTVTDNPVIDEEQIILAAPTSGSTADTYALKVNYGGTISSLKTTMSTSGVATTTATATGYTITPTKAGTTTLTVTDPESDFDSVEIIVGTASISGNNQLEVGTSTQLTATITPDAIKTNDVYWESSDSLIAAVGTSTGLVSGVKAGTVTITATVLDNNEKPTNIKASKTITVLPDIQLSVDDTVVIGVGNTIDITDGTSMDDTKLTFTSSDTTVATVSNAGVIKGLETGTTNVTVSYPSGASKTVKVKVIVGSIAIQNASVAVGSTTVINKTVAPSALDSYGIVWSTSDSSIATVDSTGTVTGIKIGTAKITAKIAGTTISGTSTVTVKSKDEVTFSSTEATTAVGNSIKLPYTYSGTGTITWKSSDTTVATVANGTVTGVKAGTATITATNSNTGEQASILVTVIDLSVKPVSELVIGEMTNAVATPLPGGVQGYLLTYESEDTSVFTVDQYSGSITAIGAGTGNLKVTLTKNGASVSKEVSITVVKGDITITGPSGEILTNSTIYTVTNHAPIVLKATGTSSASKFTWSSSNTDIATVDSTGIVTMTGNYGSATITVSDENSNNPVTVTIKVIGGNISMPLGNSIYYPGVTTNATEAESSVKPIVLQILPMTPPTYSVSSKSSDASVINVKSTSVTGATVTAVNTGVADVVYTLTVGGLYGGTLECRHTMTVQDDAVAQVVHTENSQTTITKYATVLSAFDAAENGDTVQMIKDIPSTDTVHFCKGATYIDYTGKNLTFDLNGYAISQSSCSEDYMLYSKDDITTKLVITDSKTGGSIESTNGRVIWAGNDTTLTVNAGTVIGKTNAIYNNGGVVRIYAEEKDVLVKSTDTTNSTIVTSGNVYIGLETDEKIYATSDKYENEITLDVDETRPQLYVGGGQYGIEIQVDTSSATDKTRLYWYNGEIYGATQAFQILDSSNTDITKELDTSGVFEMIMNDHYMNNADPWSISGLAFSKFPDITATAYETVYSNIPTEMYYKTVNVFIGDSNLDGSQSVSDAVYLNQDIAIAKPISGEEFLNSDLNGDGELTGVDALIMMKYLVHSVTVIPVSDKFYIYEIVEPLMGNYTDKELEDEQTYSLISYNIYNNRYYKFVADSQYYNNKLIFESITREDIINGGDITLVQGTDYKYEDGSIQFITTYEDISNDLVENYGLTKREAADGAYFYINYKYGDKKISLKIHVSEASSSSSTYGDFDFNGSVSQSDYNIFVQYKNGNLAITSDQSTAINNYMSYLSTKLSKSISNSTATYYLRRKIITGKFGSGID